MYWYLGKSVRCRIPFSSRCFSLSPSNPLSKQALRHFPPLGLLVKGESSQQAFCKGCPGWELGMKIIASFTKRLPNWAANIITTPLPRMSPAKGRGKKQCSMSHLHHRQDPPLAHWQSPSMWARTLWSWIWTILPPVWWASPPAQVWL